MSPGAFRTLTSGERALAAEVFGAGLDAASVRLFALPVWDRAFVAGGRLMVWPARAAWRDFTAAPLEVQAVFIHELVHVWQAQNGVNLILAKLRAGDRAQAYAYDLSDNRDFPMLNIEQQAMIVQDAFTAARGGPAPYESQAYSVILATWPGCPGSSPREV
jgi:hypothetical protein